MNVHQVPGGLQSFIQVSALESLSFSHREEFFVRSDRKTCAIATYCGRYRRLADARMTNMFNEVFVTSNLKMVLRTDSSEQGMHCHRPIELIKTLDGPIEMLCEDQGALVSDCFLVPPMRRHALRTYEGRIARMYVDSGYRSVAAWKTTRIATEFETRRDLPARLVRIFEGDASAHDAFALMRFWSKAWVDEQPDVPSDPRVALVLRHLDEQDMCARGDRGSMAALVGLSPSRFAAIFAADTGTSLGRYLIWRRVKIALALICKGESVTTAALTAGFSDGAHLTRSCRATYGCPPSSVVNLLVRYEFSEEQGATKSASFCLDPHPLSTP